MTPNEQLARQLEHQRSIEGASMTISEELVTMLDDLLSQSRSIGLSEGHPLHSRHTVRYAEVQLAEDRAAFIELLRSPAPIVRGELRADLVPTREEHEHGDCAAGP